MDHSEELAFENPAVISGANRHLQPRIKWAACSEFVYSYGREMRLRSKSENRVADGHADHVPPFLNEVSANSRRPNARARSREGVNSQISVLSDFKRKRGFAGRRVSELREKGLILGSALRKQKHPELISSDSSASYLSLFVANCGVLWEKKAELGFGRSWIGDLSYWRVWLEHA
jgi:hypothetical protein